MGKKLDELEAHLRSEKQHALTGYFGGDKSPYWQAYAHALDDVLYRISWMKGEEK